MTQSFSSQPPMDTIRLTDDELYQKSLEEDFIQSTVEWIREKRNGTNVLVICAEDWHMHVREETGGGCNAAHLVDTSLWDDMTRALTEQLSIARIEYTADYELVVHW